MTTVEQPSIEQMNRVIAEFMGFEVVDVGYFGQNGYDDGFDETEWQIKNRDWLDKVGIESVGKYIVNLTTDDWFEWRGVLYHSSWDFLMPVYKKISDHFYGAYVGDKDQQGMKSALESIHGALKSANILDAHLHVYNYITQNKQQ